jgi:uncharacterized SAM-binding protein YcdF (DUF218 family)
LRFKRFFYIGLFIILFLFGLFIFYRPILEEAGRFLTPKSQESADLVIVAGNQIIKNAAFDTSIRLLSLGKAKSVAVVLHLPPKEGQLFGIQESYPLQVIKEMEHAGIEKDKIKVLLTPFDGHPITLREAQFVIERLSGDGIRSAILVSEGFHTRRSLGVYRQEGARVGIHVIPYPYFIEYESDSWWNKPDGWRAFLQESLKLVYYVLRGYVSVKYLMDYK